MYKELEYLLLKLPFDELKKALGKEVCDIVDYLTGDLTAPSLIKIGVRGFGKTLLERPEFRTLLILNCLKEDELKKLGNVYGVNNSDFSELVLQIGSKPFKYDSKSKIFLESLKLPESYLPDRTKEKEEGVINIKPQNNFYELLDYQFDIKMQALKYFREMPNARALIHMPTGAGKTKTAMHLIHEYWNTDNNNKGYILWLAHSEELLRQAIDAFMSIWSVLGKSETFCMKVWGSFNFPNHLPTSGIFFIGIQKLISIAKRNEDSMEFIRRDTRMIVIDEAHKAPATETYEAVKELLKIEPEEPNRVLLGLTATPGRKSGYDIEDIKLKSLFDGVKINVDLKLMKKYTPGGRLFNSVINLLQSRNVLSTFEREEINFDPSELNLTPQEKYALSNYIKAEKEIPSQILNKLGKSRIRNQTIIKRLKELLLENISTLVFACNRDHAKLISAALNLEGIYCGLILGETDSSERARLIKEFKSQDSDMKTLVNVSVLTTGFDSPNIDCVFIARPISSIILYSQIIGRGIRGPLMGGNKKCKLIEVVDGFQLGDESWAYKYFDQYWE